MGTGAGVRVEADCPRERVAAGVDAAAGAAVASRETGFRADEGGLVRDTADFSAGVAGAVLLAESAVFSFYC